MIELLMLMIGGVIFLFWYLLKDDSLEKEEKERLKTYNPEAYRRKYGNLG